MCSQEKLPADQGGLTDKPEATPKMENSLSEGSKEDGISGDESSEETSDDDVTEEQDSDDEREVEGEPQLDTELVATDSTSSARLLEQSELSLLGVASEEYLLQHLESMPREMPESRNREHLTPQPRHKVPPQSPKLAILEVHTAPLCQDEPIQKDRRLANWDRWLTDRKRQHRHIGSVFNNRAPASLAMNSGKDRRFISERKTVLDYTRIPAPPDYYRGGPEFWKMPYFLPDKPQVSKKHCLCGNRPYCHCDRGDRGEAPLYSAQMTLPDKGIIPTMEYIGEPDHVKKEKEVYGHLDRKSPRDIWNSNTYMNEQKVKMKEKLKLVEQHEPDMRDLVIVGNYWQKIEMAKMKDVPVLTVSEEPVEMKEREFEDELTGSLMSMIQEEHEGKSKAYRDLNGVACLKIQEREFYYFDPPKSRKIALKMARERLLKMNNQENPVEFRMSFNSHPGKVETKILRLENRGTVKVSYSWKRCKARTPDFPVEVPMKTNSSGPHFFFNKNHDLLLPGQVLEFRFMYRSHHPGVFQECWTLHTEPAFVADEDVFTVNLWGISTFPDEARDELRRLRAHVEQRVAEAIGREIIQDSLESAKHPISRDHPYAQHFLIEEKFLHVNPDFNYETELVKQLCDIHDEICLPDSSEEWDLKILTLRQKIIDRTSDVPRQEYLDKLSEIAFKLRKRTYTTRNGTLRKYTCVYNLLCNLANTIDREGANLRDMYGLEKLPVVLLESKHDKSEERMKSTPTKSNNKLKKVLSKTKGKHGSKIPSTTKDFPKTSTSNKLLHNDSSSSSLSKEGTLVGSKATQSVISPSKMQAMTATFTTAAGFSESTIQLLSSLNMPVVEDPVPPVAMFPIVVPAKGETPSAEVDENLVRRVYRQSLYTMVNQALCYTVEHIAAVLDSYSKI